MCASLARSTVLHPGESMKNIALGQEEVYSCAFWLLTMISLRNPWAATPQDQSLGTRPPQFPGGRGAHSYIVPLLSSGVLRFSGLHTTNFPKNCQSRCGTWGRGLLRLGMTTSREGEQRYVLFI